MSVKGHFKIEIFTKPYLKQYLFSLYGNPIVYNETDFFALMLVSALEKNVYVRETIERIEHRFLDVYTEPLEIYFPLDWLKYYFHGNGISKQKMIFINKLVSQRFEEDLFRYCWALDILNVDRKDGIVEFCRLSGIEIDVHVTHEALRKMEYRFRKKLEKYPTYLSHQKGKYTSVTLL